MTTTETPDTSVPTLTWTVIDAVTWNRVTTSSWPSRETAEAAIVGWHKPAAKKRKLPDVDLSGMVLIPVPDELLRQAEEGRIAAKRADSAVVRTFEMSELLLTLRAETDPLRDLLRRVAVHCIPRFYEMRGDSMDSIWREVREATERAHMAGLGRV